MDTDADYLLAVAWIDAYRADPDTAVMVAEQFQVGRIGLGQAVMAWLSIINTYKSSV
jgi:hypothetical protein